MPSFGTVTARVTLFTLLVFAGCIWSLAFYASRMLHQDMERISGEQQYSAVAYLASEIRHEMQVHAQALEHVATRMGKAALGTPNAWHKQLHEREDLHELFRGGVYVTNAQGEVLDSTSPPSGAIGEQFSDRPNVALALQQGKTTFSDVQLDKRLNAPAFSIASPVRSPQGQVVGSLVGVISLDQPNFLDVITENRYGKTGRYVVASKSQRLIIAASKKEQVMQSLPGVGTLPTVDRFVQGFEGSVVFVNARGMEVLTTVKGIEHSDWFIAASIPTEEAFAPIHTLQNRMLIAATVLTLLAAWLTRWMVRRQLAPMVTVASALRQVSVDTQMPQSLPIARDDEIGQLIGGFNGLLKILREHEAALQDEKERYRSLVEKLRLSGSVFTYAREGIMVTAADGRIIDVNDAFVNITGFSKEEVIGQNPRIFSSGRQGADFYRSMWTDLNHQGHWEGEVWNRRKNGEVYAEMLTISAVRDQQEKIQHYVALFSDITANKEHQRKLERLAHHDALTGLPNRALLADRILQAIARARRNGEIVAVVGLDLDGFKAVNDNHGHDAGDRLLIEISHRLVRSLRTEDTAARLGGDEFVMLLTGVHSQADCERTLQRILNAINQPVELDAEHAVQVSGSMGYTLFPADDADADTLLRHADVAMYSAKQSGKNRFAQFDLKLNNRQKANMGVTTRMEKGLQRNEFVLYVQPKVNIQSGKIMGAEALIRWQHPIRGLVPPIEFLPLVSLNRDLALRFDQWVLDESLRLMDQWVQQGLHLQLSINMSSHQFLEEDFAARIGKALSDYPNVRAQDLEIEIVESAALDDVQQVANLIGQCQHLGVRFALDDFGTGFSTLAYLKQLKVNTLKIDQSFVNDMTHNKSSLAIVQGVIGLANAFDCELVAEGVEKREQAEILKRLGCHVVQGYLISRPMPSAELVEWVQNFDATWEKINEQP